MKLKKTKREVNTILAVLRSFRQVLTVKDPGLDFTKIDPLYNDLEKEVSEQGHELIRVAAIPPTPRKPKVILAAIAEGEKVTPELVDEIKRGQKATK